MTSNGSGNEKTLLREMNTDDHQALFLVLGDPETMRHYPCTFDVQRVKDWIERNMDRYQNDGFGLWAVCLKETGELIGDCGLHSRISMERYCRRSATISAVTASEKAMPERPQKQSGIGHSETQIIHPCIPTANTPMYLP